MKTYNQLKRAIDNNIPLIWNDPDPIKGADYTIKAVHNVEQLKDWATEEIQDFPILITYGENSEAEIYINEIVLK